MSIPQSFFNVEAQRTKEFFYSFLFDVTSRLSIFTSVLSIIQKTLRTKKFALSQRLKYILEKLKTEDDSVVQHGLVFYALSHDIDVRNFVICHYDVGEKRSTIEDFLTNHIDKRTEDLLNGKFKSLTEYVEDIRFHLLIELGV